MRKLAYEDVYRLEECLRELAGHHNGVSVHFRGQYPKKPFAETLASFREDVRSGRSEIGVVEEAGKIAGFCKADFDGVEGTVAYLIVRKEARGKGYGDMLLEWAMDLLKQKGVSRTEVRVVDGNDAVGFYEKHGFRMCSHILRYDNDQGGRDES